jgi:hypothetical protein
MPRRSKGFQENNKWATQANTETLSCYKYKQQTKPNVLEI